MSLFLTIVGAILVAYLILGFLESL